MPGKPQSEAGFTLLESLVAIAILAMVVTYVLATRTTALTDAAETRNWRIAREIAEHHLSEIQAGARELPPESGAELRSETYPDFRYRIMIGEAAVADAEADIAEMEAEYAPEGSSSGNRVAWQRERDRIRRAQQSGMSMLDYEEQLRAKEFEQVIPSDDELEEVAVMVTFPNIRPSEMEGKDYLTFVLKTKISTMAIQGLTPEKAALVAELRGDGDGDETASAMGLGGDE